MKNKRSRSSLKAHEGFTSNETITSLEIAQITGKMHKNIIRSIRQMEPAWEKVQGSKFELSSITYDLCNDGHKQTPIYILNKYECLYIATKFSDEARAILVKRWMELEVQSQQQQRLGGPKRKAPRFHNPNKLYSVSEIASEYGIQAADMNVLLSQAGIQVKSGKDWVLSSEYVGHGFAVQIPFYCTTDGVKRVSSYFLKWTQKGKDYINTTLENMRYVQETRVKIENIPAWNQSSKPN